MIVFPKCNVLQLSSSSSLGSLPKGRFQTTLLTFNYSNYLTVLKHDVVVVLKVPLIAVNSQPTNPTSITNNEANGFSNLTSLLVWNLPITDFGF